MAKTKAPLFSFDARGQLAEALVYGRWKGLQTIRQYVTPADPKTAGQLTQRGYFADAVALYQSIPWNQDHYEAGFLESQTNDSIALARSARLDPRPMSGFNWAVKQIADSYRRGDAKTDMFSNQHVQCDRAGFFTCMCQLDGIDIHGDIQFRWGTRPTFMPNIELVNTDVVAYAPRDIGYYTDQCANTLPNGTEIFCRFEYKPGAIVLWQGPICRFLRGCGDDQPMH